MHDFTQQEMLDRLAHIREAMRAEGLGACVLSDVANVRYATGFRGEPRTLLITEQDAVLYTSFRTRRWAEAQATTVEISTDDDPLTSIASRLGAIDQKLVGTDLGVSHQRLMQLRSRLNNDAIESCDAVERVRRCKSEREIELMAASQHRNEAVLDAVLPQIRPGMTERAVQGLILSAIAADAELDGYAFPPIVAAGPNAWEIHHLPDDTPLRANDMVILDLGVVYRGYASDMTRTVCLGEPTDAMRGAYDTVGRAQRAAMEALRPGATTRAVDEAARAVIRDAGLGRGFTHGLGHSIGLETHDPGLNLSPKTPDIAIEPGMAFTLEPGAYLEDAFGVRTEDTVVVRDDAPQNLTRWPHELMRLPI